MLTDPRPQGLDLLVVGGLTVDRFADGPSGPGGSVLHVARAAKRRGIALGVRTSAGPEPEAVAGVAELHRLAERVDVARHATTATFRHRESVEGRRLWLERAGGPVADGPGASRDAATVLYAPVFDEVAATAIAASASASAGAEGRSGRGAILQGWLRQVAEDGEVHSLPLASLAFPLRDALAGLDLLVASHEDLRADGATADQQLVALRRTFGVKPALVVTDGVDGLWLDTGAVPTHISVPRRVEAARTVGAGDVLAAFLVIGARNPPGSWRARAEEAMSVVADELELRPRS
jgi:hypothetical protein